MRRHRLLLILGVCALLLTPNAGGGPTVPGDPTPPVVTPHIFGTLGLNGWYVTNVTVNWTVEDPESQILETRGCDAITLVNDTTGTPLTCYARSDGGETTVTITIRLDKTAPTVTATPARGPDSNGWYNHALSVGFSGTDATSGIDSCVPSQTYSGPDSANASVSGSCRDRAGNTGTQAFNLNYDATAPQVTGANASRSPDHAGWYNHTLSISFTGADATSGLESCTQATYSGPDDPTASVNGTCRDRAGNTSDASAFNFQYDETGPSVTATPSRSPDSNGWYNHGLSVSFSGNDPTSGIDTCVPAQGYSGPDNANASVNGSCTDHAGNTTNRAFNFSYDGTVPQVTSVTPSRAPDHGGWYNHTFSIAFAGTDATSGMDTCTQATYSGPDDATASVNGTCRDRAGNTSNASAFNFQYDETDPSVTASPSRAPDSNGWYNHTLTVSFSGTDATSGVESCVPPVSYSGPDSANASVSGTCTDHAGNSGSRSLGFSYDDTAPQVTRANPSRPPDHGGWYNHTFSIAFVGADATSGIDTCTQATYSGPDDATASVNGTCRDRAGNTSVPFPFSFQYDATDPTVTATPSRNPDSNGWYNHPLSVGFAGSDAVSGIESCVPPQTYSGPDSANASVSGTCQDHAGNTGSRAFSLSYDGTGPVVTATPSRAPDSNGWYNHVLTVAFSGTDAMSGLDSCVPAQSYSGPDDPTASVNGSCVDRAGNTTARAFGLSYDGTGPTVSASPGRAPDSQGWYNHALTVTFSGTDATSGVASCVPPQTYAGPDDPEASVSGSCVDHAGNTNTRFRAELRRDRARGQRDAGARARLERLVQPRDFGRLQRRRCDLGDRFLRPAADVLGPRPRRRRGSRLLPGPGREHRRALVRAQLRRHGARGHRGGRVTGARSQRLVQPRAHRQLHRLRCHLGRRLLHGDDLFGPRRRERLGHRNVPRSGREHERRRRLRVPVRRDGTSGDTHPGPRPRLERLVQPRSLRQLRGDRRHLRARLLCSVRRPTPARIRRTHQSPARASTMRGTRAWARSG